MSGKSAETTRRKLLETAADLFYREGIHASGVDAVVEAAGVSKPTLYRHFKSKQDLVAATLEWRARCQEEEIQRLLDRPGSPRDRLLGLFDWRERWMNKSDFRGCPVVNAAAELVHISDPGRKISRDHKRRIREMIERVVVEGRFWVPRELVEGLMLLLEGATAMAYVGGDTKAGRNARRTAERLLEAHTQG